MAAVDQAVTAEVRELLTAAARNQHDIDELRAQVAQLSTVLAKAEELQQQLVNLRGQIDGLVVEKHDLKTRVATLRSALVEACTMARFPRPGDRIRIAELMKVAGAR